MSNKYGNFLTMFLVVLIVAILGILGYFVYDMLHSKSVNTNAQTALEQFEQATSAVKKDNASLSTSKDGKEDKTNTVTNTNTNTATNEVTNTTSNTTALDKLNEFNNYVNSTQPETTVPENTEPEKVYMEDYEVLGRIEIPKTKVDYPILENVTKRSLEIAVGKAYGPGLNEPGNTTIFGHNYRNGLFFSNNKKLSNGDKIYITDATGNKVTYIIYNIYQTLPSDASYMQRETNGRREISLQTCTDDSSARIIIWAAEQEKTQQ